MILTSKNKYQEDISVLVGGTELIAVPCVVYSITISKESDGDAAVSFSNSITAYSATYRVLKLVTTAEQHTVHIEFPNGLKLSSGLSAVSNVASVDVCITYE